MSGPDDAGPHPPRVVFFTDNGLGLGHMTRLLAVARQAAGRFQPMAMTLSMAYPLLSSQGIPAEHFPSYGHLGMKKGDWSSLLTDRLLETLAWTEAGVVVVDHVSPPKTFRTLRQLLPDLHLIWSRRGLWRKGKNKDALRESDAFHTIVEPGDVAAAIDVGLTATSRERVVRLSPVVLVGPEDYVPRTEARLRLGLPQTGRAFLLQLGADTADALHEAIQQTRDAIRAAVGSEEVHLFAPLHPFHADAIDEIEGVHMKPVYPVARYFRAFNGAVSMAGYNAYHEIVVSGLPAVFLARNSKIDDQPRRARFAEWSGRGFYAESFTGKDFRAAVAKMVRPEEPAIASSIANALGPMHGAREFADLLSSLPPSAAHAPTEADLTAVITEVLSDLPRRLGEMELTPDDNIVISTARLGPEEARATTRLTESLPQSVVLLVGPNHEPPDLSFESVMDPDEWTSVGAGRYEDYLSSRIRRMGRRYSAAATIDLQPDR